MSQQQRYRTGTGGKDADGEQAEFTAVDAGDTSKLEEALKQAAAKEQKLQQSQGQPCRAAHCRCPACIDGKDCANCWVDSGRADAEKYRNR